MRRLPPLTSLLLVPALLVGVAAALVPGGHSGHHGHHGMVMSVSWPLTLVSLAAVFAFAAGRRRGLAAFALLTLAVHFHPLPLPGQDPGPMPPVCCVLAQSAAPEAPVAPAPQRLVVRLGPELRTSTPDTFSYRTEPIRGPPGGAASPPRAA